MNDKAQVGIQFNWIFVILIGAVLLGFFFSFIFSSTSSNEKEVSATIARHFETIITSTNQKIGTVKSYKIPLSELEFTCDNFQDVYQYSIGGVKAKDTKYELIFSSKKLYGTRIYTWTEKWNIPYQVATFLYITNDKEHFSFIPLNNQLSSFEEELVDNFATNISSSVANKTNSGDYENIPSSTMNMDKYTYVLIKKLSSNLPDPSTFIEVPKNKVSIIVLEPTREDLFDQGNVYFFDYDKYKSFVSSTTQETNYDSMYLGKASLYAAIFAGNKERYVCGMNKALKKLKIVSEIQKYKILNENQSIDSICRSHLIGDESIDQLKGAIYFIEDIISQSQNGFSETTLTKIIADINQLEKKNNEIIIEYQCPAIY